MDEPAGPDVLLGPVRGDLPATRPPDFDTLFRTEFPRVARTVHHIVGDRASGRRGHPGRVPRAAPALAQGQHATTVRSCGYAGWRSARRSASGTAPGGVPSSSASTVEPHASEPPTPAPEVLRAVRELGPKQRAIVVLFYFEDRPMAEIAEIVGCSESTGWSQLHHARRRLAAILGEEVTDDVG